MKKYFYAMLFSLVSLGITAQTPKSKDQSKAINEIDRLVQKYKDVPRFTLTNVYGEVITEFDIKYNVNNKPYSISMVGKTENQKALAAVIYSFIQEKRKKGYIAPDKNSTYNLDEIESDITNLDEGFIKGDMVFIIKTSSSFETGTQVISFTITNGDLKRKTVTGKKVDF
jgi:hypothetical protein